MAGTLNREQKPRFFFLCPRASTELAWTRGEATHSNGPDPREFPDLSSVSNDYQKFYEM